NPAAGVNVNDPSAFSTTAPWAAGGAVSSTALSGPVLSGSESFDSTPGAATVSAWPACALNVSGWPTGGRFVTVMVTVAGALAPVLVTVPGALAAGPSVTR